MMKQMVLGFAMVVLISGCASVPQAGVSPKGKVQAKVYVDGQGDLAYTLNRGATPVMLPSKMGITIDGVELGKGVELKSVSVEAVTGSFEWLGTSSTVENNYVAESFEVTHLESGGKWTLETRCYDTGFAFRYVIPGEGDQKVDGEGTTWTLPEGAQLWYHKNGGAFQTYWKKQPAAEIKEGFNAQLNVTVELSDGSFASLNEAGSFSFSGTSLVFDGSNEATTLFAGDKEGWTIKGEVATPWRIVMTATDLNTLVNCNLTAAVCPAPDKTLFPEGCRTDWIQPGRSLWQWWGYWNPGTLWEKQHWFVDNAAALGCQYYLVDEGWEHPAQGWVTDTRTAWEALTELSEYAKSRGVKLLVWRSYPASEKAYYEGLETPEKRRRFFENCKKAG
ncbi:MAG: glycoside hydrolase family 97 N-terminal domain-containing protein, partial [Verrucomicrobia bacterium]|nr:glycoside hydrolase family 97 N-terminal domain-containing protein [Verrucomicrobiota bacterium]